MKSFKTEGIVIKRINSYEADRIITIFTKNKGKIKVRAKGVRKITSRRSSHIELLNISIFNLYQGKSLPILTEVETIESFSEIKNNLSKIGIAYHFLELIDGLCAENQENEEIYNLLFLALNKISSDDRHDLIAYRFELRLLKLLGFSNDSQNLTKEQMQPFIESLLERKLKTRQILPKLS